MSPPNAIAASGNLPLNGIVVIAIEQAVAMPLCTARLADAGARVIKVERPEGDFAREYDQAANGLSSYFVWLNRGKESVALNLVEPGGRAQLTELLAMADVFVQNLKPGALERLGFATSLLREKWPELICCTITGYGDAGPMAHRKAYDLLIQAESGLASLTGSPDQPARVGISVVDIATGATAHAAILEALLARAQGRGGADIRVSMFDVIAEWLTVPLLHTEAGKPPQRVGLRHPSIAPYGAFRTADGRELLISIQNDREWAALCNNVLGCPELVSDESYCTNGARVRNRAQTDALVAAAFMEATFEELVARLQPHEIAFAEVNDMNGLARHPHLRRITVDTPAGPISYPAPAPVFVGYERSYGAVPAIGQNQLQSDVRRND